jgi:hypothetical protein
MRLLRSGFRSLVVVAALVPWWTAVSVAQQPEVHYVFQPPAGWVLAQQDSSASLLTREGVTGYILVLPNGLKDLKSFEEEMRKGLIDEGMCRLYPRGKLEKAGKNMLAGDFEGEFQTKQAKARVIGICSDIGGGGVYVLGVDAQETFSRQLAEGANAVARAMRFKSSSTPAGK